MFCIDVRVKEMEPDSFQGCHWTRSNGYKLRFRNSCLKIGRNLFNLRVTKCWNRLHGEVMEPSSLEILFVFPLHLPPQTHKIHEEAKKAVDGKVKPGKKSFQTELELY